MIIPIDVRAFDKNKHSVIIKTLSKLRIEGNFLKLIKGVYKKKSIADIINTGKNRSALSLRRGKSKDVCSQYLQSSLHWKS